MLLYIFMCIMYGELMFVCICIGMYDFCTYKCVLFAHRSLVYYICMHVCMYACMYVCMYVCYVCMYVRMYVCMYVCMCAMYVCVHVVLLYSCSALSRVDTYTKNFLSFQMLKVRFVLV